MNLIHHQHYYLSLAIKINSPVCTHINRGSRQSIATLRKVRLSKGWITFGWTRNPNCWITYTHGYQQYHHSLRFNKWIRLHSVGRSWKGHNAGLGWLVWVLTKVSQWIVRAGIDMTEICSLPCRALPMRL